MIGQCAIAPLDEVCYSTMMPIPLLLHGRHATTPVHYEPFGPWIVPWRFADAQDEYRALRTATGLIDYSTQALLTVTGNDRADFLHRVLTNEIRRLTPGAGCRAALLTASAKLLADLLVLVEAEAIRLLCDLPRAQTVAQTLARYLFAEAVTVHNGERQTAVLALQGPKTLDILSHVTGSPVALTRAGDHAVPRLDGIPLHVIHHSLIGEAGVLCLIAPEQLDMAWRILQDRGRALGLMPVGWEALNTARIEAGVPWFGLDMDEDNLLPETGLEAVAVSDSKGCYVGQEIVARMQTYGSASKKLMGLIVSADEVPQAGDPIDQHGEEAGRVTSGCFSWTLNRPIAMGYVKRGTYEPGTAVDILRGERRLAALVASRPLVPAGS